MVSEFRRSFNLPVADAPVRRVPTLKSRSLAASLVDEESTELIDELEALADMFDMANVAKELADVVYIAYGIASEYGIPLDDVIAAVHKSNMSKLWPDGKPRYHDGSHAQPKGKVKKPPTYRPPDIAAVLGQ